MDDAAPLHRSIRDDQGLDPQFASLLRHHWMEEAQHAKLDTLMVGRAGQGHAEAEIVSAVDGYLEIGGMIDDGAEAAGPVRPRPP